jgi:murein L,D-transpeptidase YafK
VILRKRLLVLGAVLALSTLGAAASWWYFRLRPDHADEARRRVGPQLDADLKSIGSSLGSPVFIRVFKEPPVLELWVRSRNQFVLFKKYPVCRFSGTLGPKTSEGDMQAPEGLYTIRAPQLNARSRFYLSLNLGYPNPVEAARGWTGNSLMIHGDCVSIGCYAMGDHAISEIYTAIDQALRNGQDAFSVQALPFPLETENLTKHAQSPFFSYWESLVEAYQTFERTRLPPQVDVSPRGYVITSP